MKRVIGYCRVSTKAQGVSGLGIEAQESALSRYARQHGYEILDVVTEVASGGSADRPGLQGALEAARKAGATVLVAKLCRLSRSAAFVTALMERGVSFEDADSGPEVGNLMLGIKAVVNEDERRKISERTRAALAAKRARGEPLGNVVNLELHGERGRQTQRDRACERIEPYRMVFAELAGVTLREIATRLNDRMVRTPRGGRWHPQQVAVALKRLELE